MSDCEHKATTITRNDEEQTDVLECSDCGKVLSIRSVFTRNACKHNDRNVVGTDLVKCMKCGRVK